MRVSTGLTRARRSQAALALDPLPASKVQSAPRQFAELDKHNFRDWQRTQTQSSVKANKARDSKWMSGSANAGTTAERRVCELRVLP